MAITASRPRRAAPARPSPGARGALAIGSALALALPLPSGATDWSFLPTLRLRESYSDNIHLAPPAQAKSDLVSEVTPAIAVAAIGPHLKLDLAYSLQTLFYASGQEALNHALSATANAELVDNWLFLDARSSVGRQNISAFGPQAFDNLQRSDNQSNVQAHRVSPFLRHQFRAFATAELRYAHERVSSGHDFLDVNTDALQLKLTGDNGGRGWNWDARYEARQSDDASAGKVRGHTESATLRYPVSAQLGVFGSAGYESEGYAVNAAAQPAGRFWAVGGTWIPSRRSSLALSAGKRFFGSTYSLSATQRARATIWSLGYGEDITTSSREFLRLSRNDAAGLLDELWSASIPNPQLRQQVVGAFLNTAQLLGPDRGAINYFSHTYFLQKQLSLSVAATSARSTFLLGLSATRRTAQSSGALDSVLLPPNQQLSDASTSQRGASVGWNWRMTPRTSLNASLAADRVDTLDRSRRDGNLALSVGLSRVLRPRVHAEVNLRHMRHNSTLSGAEYRENGIGATLNFQL